MNPPIEEYVRGSAARRRRWRLVRFAVQTLVAIVLAWLLYFTPTTLYIIAQGAPIVNWQTWWGAFLGFCTVLYIGKNLYDTLFYDHFQP